MRFVDGFDVALRLLLSGSFSSSAAARDLSRRVVDALGEQIETEHLALSRLVPTAARVAAAGAGALVALGVSQSRSEEIVAVARLVADQTLRLEPGCDVAETHRILTDVARVSQRLATLIVMRALSWPDAWPDAEPRLQRVVEALDGDASLAGADMWQPWRSYAAVHLLTKSPGR